MRSHEKTHLPQELIPCPKCEQRFRQTSMKQHILTHSSEKSHACSKCEKVFRNKNNREAHEIVHTSMTPLKCKECGKLLRTKLTLKRHEVTHIERKKEYSCSFCSTAFTTRSYLTKHEVLHKDSGSYPCSTCGKTFILKGYLERHERTHRSASNMYKCSECDKSYPTSALLKRHNRTHTGERPFSCDICAQSFTRKFPLASHKKLMHSATTKRKYTFRQRKLHFTKWITPERGKEFETKTELYVHNDNFLEIKIIIYFLLVATLIDADRFWLTLIVTRKLICADWCWLLLIDAYWFWLRLTHADCFWEMMLIVAVEFSKSRQWPSPVDCRPMYGLLMYK